MTDEKQLKSLQDLLVVELMERIESGEATPSDLNTARQLLKDNAIIVDVIRDEGPIHQLSKLPFIRAE